MAAEEETESWQWADADGVVSIVDEWELISSLSTGTLPAYTLVWRETWKEWLPACQVAELANVLPRDQVEKAVTPGIDKSMKEPPPPPTDRYQTFRAREAASRLLGKARALKTPVPPPPGKTPPPPKPGLGAPPARPRPVQPTIVETNTTPATATLRPPGAVPPPPRGVPVPATLAAPPVPRDPGRKITDALAAPVTPTIQLLDSGPSSEQPTNPRASAGPLPSYVDDDDAELRARALRPGPVSVHLPTPAPPPATTPKGTSIGMVSALGIAIIVALGLVIGSIVIVKMRADEVPSASASGGAGRPATLTACKLVKPARRLATPIEASVNPNWATYGSGFAVGYAETTRVAGGITLDPIALEPKRVFDQKVSTNLLGVVPITQGALGFEPDLDEGDLNPKRTLDTKPRIRLGVTSAGFSRQEGNEESSTIWPGSADKEATDPRVAALPGGGYAVTLRRGGISGSVLVGLLDKDGRRASDLLVIGSKPQVGTPNVAANAQGVLVAFAGRPSNDAYWKLQLAKSTLGEVPRSASSFPSPPGGPGGDEISPVAVGLERGGWLLQWTEGPAGRRQVRVQTVGFDLIPVGDPITVSPEQANAGQGVVMVREGKALSLFLVKQGKNHELWGASLICP
jgi:hypothetical protein